MAMLSKANRSEMKTSKKQRLPGVGEGYAFTKLIQFNFICMTPNHNRSQFNALYSVRLKSLHNI